MRHYATDIKNLRILSQVFSPAFFNNIIRGNDFSLFDKKIAKFSKNFSHLRNRDLVKDIYKSLQKKYRCEYVYKNTLFIEIIKKYGLKDTLTINELKIGASKADLTLLNGSVRVYEIKTALDGLGKLSKQLTDYQKFADVVYVITDEKYVKKLYNEYLESNIGIISLTIKNEMKIVKEAKHNGLLFNFDTIFKVLRKQEYLDLVETNFGYIPDVPNTKIFRVCYKLLSTVELLKFQKQVLFKLKERELSKPDLLISANTPVELKHICNTLDFNEFEYEKLFNFLENDRTCTNLT